ncbi:hypothetical protein, partial [Tropicimonas marinistellae]|uniref:hypothetical protein n=1 Tax=Tropicimonas marinistellae TaxID=1739787 RepID=UPI00082DBDD3
EQEPADDFVAETAPFEPETAELPEAVTETFEQEPEDDFVAETVPFEPEVAELPEPEAETFEQEPAAAFVAETAPFEPEAAEQPEPEAATFEQAPADDFVAETAPFEAEAAEQPEPEAETFEPEPEDDFVAETAPFEAETAEQPEPEVATFEQEPADAFVAETAPFEAEVAEQPEPEAETVEQEPAYVAEPDQEDAVSSEELDAYSESQPVGEYGAFDETPPEPHADETEESSAVDWTQVFADAAPSVAATASGDAAESEDDELEPDVLATEDESESMDDVLSALEAQDAAKDAEADDGDVAEEADQPEATADEVNDIARTVAELTASAEAEAQDDDDAAESTEPETAEAEAEAEEEAPSGRVIRVRKTSLMASLRAALSGVGRRDDHAETAETAEAQPESSDAPTDNDEQAAAEEVSVPADSVVEPTDVAENEETIAQSEALHAADTDQVPDDETPETGEAIAHDTDDLPTEDDEAELLRELEEVEREMSADLEEIASREAQSSEEAMAALAEASLEAEAATDEAAEATADAMAILEAVADAEDEAPEDIASEDAAHDDVDAVAEEVDTLLLTDELEDADSEIDQAGALEPEDDLLVDSGDLASDEHEDAAPIAEEAEAEEPGQEDEIAETRVVPDPEEAVALMLDASSRIPDDETFDDAHDGSDTDTDVDPVQATVAQLAQATEDASRAEAAAERRALALEQNGEDDSKLERLLDETNSKLAGAEMQRRRSAIEHLKAAVAATKAEGPTARNSEEREAEPYRKDLAEVVRPHTPKPTLLDEPKTASSTDAGRKSLRNADAPADTEATRDTEGAVPLRRRSDAAERSTPVRPRRPVSAATGERPAGASGEGRERPRVAPLMLVSEQRVDTPEAETRKPAHERSTAPVRPRRVVTNWDDEPDTADVTHAGSEPAKPTSDSEAAEILAESTTFDDFAERMGAAGLEELLECAAAYTSYVEGRPHFSHPQIMNVVRQLDGQEKLRREDSLRTFGQLLRQGKIQKLDRGQFTLSQSSRYKPEERRAVL